MNKRLYTVKRSFEAHPAGDETKTKTITEGQTLFWDTEDTGDPITFEVDNRTFQVTRKLFAQSVSVKP